jgi:RecA/RadA recombinase
MAPKKEKEASQDPLESVIAELKKDGRIIGTRAGDEIKQQDIITTSSFEFDQRLGGGFRDSGWSRFYSDPECGKTSIALKWGANWQNKYKGDAYVLFFNAEGRITRELIERSGIDTSKERFKIVDTNNYEAIFTITEKAVLENSSGRRYFVIVDSSDACERQIDKGKQFGDADKIAGGASIISAAGRRLSLLFNVTGHHLFISSQVRDKMATGPMAGKGEQKAPSGGNAPKFYSSLTCQIKTPWTDRYIYENPSDTKSKIIGRICEIKLIKTPNESTGSTVFYPVKYGLVGGVWRAYEAFMVSQACGIISGTTWLTIEDSFYDDMQKNGISVEQKFQGEKAGRNLFDENPALVEYVFEKAKIIYGAKK